jgi:putative membrane protein
MGVFVMMFYKGYSDFGSCYIFGTWLPYVFLFLVLAAVVYFWVRNDRRKTGKDSLESLKISYAKGNMTEDEYLKKKKILTDDHRS